MKPTQQRELVGYLRKSYGVSIRRACLVIRFNRATQYYRSTKSAFHEMLLGRIESIAAVRVRYVYRRIHVFLRREGFAVNHKRVYRLYAAEGLNLRAKASHRRRRSANVRMRSHQPMAANDDWAMDFMFDRLADRRKIRLLTIFDLFTRECVALVPAFNFKSEDVVAVLERVCRERSMPKAIRCDTGTEFVAEALDKWAFWNKVVLDFSRPGNRSTMRTANRDVAPINRAI